MSYAVSMLRAPVLALLFLGVFFTTLLLLSLWILSLGEKMWFKFGDSTGTEGLFSGVILYLGEET